MDLLTLRDTIAFFLQYNFPKSTQSYSTVKARYKAINLNQISSIEISELQNSIDALNLKDPITAECFICIDDKASMQVLTDEEVIRAVESNPEVDDSDEVEEVEMMIISDKEALNNLEKVIQYLKNPPDNFTISYRELKMINGLKSKIHKHIQDNAKQLTLD
ncbi:345_t:CDS:2, partial [Entrophospora sp. SA101]